MLGDQTLGAAGEVAGEADAESELGPGEVFRNRLKFAVLRTIAGTGDCFYELRV